MLRRVSLGRLLFGCGLTIVLGASLAALALALGGGPTPPPKPLAQAIHDAAEAPSTAGFSANVQLTNHLIEGAQLASGSSGSSGSSDEGGLASSPLLSGASGRVWVSADGRARLELQAEQGDTQIIYDGSTLRMYDASTNTLYVLKAPRREQKGGAKHERQRSASVSEVEEGIAHLEKRATVSGATPTNVGGQPAYTVRVAPKEGGSLFAGIELSFDALHGTPLRAAVYSTQTSAPVIELAASSVSYEAVPDSVFDLKPPTNAKVEQLSLGGAATKKPHAGHKHKLTVHGRGPSAIAVIEQPAHGSQQVPPELEHTKIGATNAAQLKTELGTLLTFERSGVRFLLVGSVTPADIEAVARGL